MVETLPPNSLSAAHFRPQRKLVLAKGVERSNQSATFRVACEVLVRLIKPVLRRLDNEVFESREFDTLKGQVLKYVCKIQTSRSGSRGRILYALSQRMTLEESPNSIGLGAG